ncbi:DUF3574 domain-containing protein [Chlorogloeopsis sp. ULAP01]|uniref:DUF3574 domain-containing protein n=1 Tax=Chlorogloeopsis sp. ULAP01 TaxID=3056483 RepID=UPI0025AAD97E|nr:DUF3574 domain-containing protein [Chlorogloeopsis sp. ULAP01]MDM9384837.1 DUF3574 domain-containing protein [Chlorogloeopsis sp. ULAP01]
MIAWQKSLNNLILTSLLVITPVHTNTYLRAQSLQSSENSSIKILIKEELYFGLSKPNGGTISEEQWQQFLNRVITPRFQEGLTVMDGYGQYLNSSGSLNREKTKLVILIYENNHKRNQMIEEVIASYKRAFHQESVLRVTSSVKVSF